VQPFDRRRKGDLSLLLGSSGPKYHNKKEKGKWVGDSIAYVGGPVPLPVVSPTLEPSGESDHTPTRWKPNKLISLHPPQ